MGDNLETEIIIKERVKKIEEVVAELKQLRRNILIHLYLKIDTEEVYKNLKKAPEEFTRLFHFFLNFFEK